VLDEFGWGVLLQLQSIEQEPEPSAATGEKQKFRFCSGRLLKFARMVPAANPPGQKGKEIKVRRRIKSIAGKPVFSLLLALLFVAVLSSTGALAQQMAKETDSWQFGLSIYGWFPDIAGETSFTQPGGGSDFEIDIDSILDNLKFTLMGTFDVQKGRWGILTDLIYMDVGDSKTGTREPSIGGNPLPVNATADVDFDMKSWIWTLTGYYRAIERSGLTLDVLAGTRYLNVEQTLNWDVFGNVDSIPIPDRTGSATADVTIWDALIGVKGRFAFGARNAWFVPYYFDIGTGESDFTFQGIAGLGYAFHWCEVAAIWRYLYYDLDSSKAIDDIYFSGPAVGITFRW
jgi:hypothetical protein